jgi:hypothetical protein
MERLRVPPISIEISMALGHLQNGLLRGLHFRLTLKTPQPHHRTVGFISDQNCLRRQILVLFEKENVKYTEHSEESGGTDPKGGPNKNSAKKIAENRIGDH